MPTEKGEPMADYIDREKLLEDLERFAPECRATFLIVRKQNAADAVPVVHGCWMWEPCGDLGHRLVCSVCGSWWAAYIENKYCANCGAKMCGDGDGRIKTS